MNELEKLEPKNVFKYFREIAAIPHGSYHTKQISDYLANFAKEHKLECYQDEMDNIIIIKHATRGYEVSPPVIIQGHMDMVCEKENDCEIDFEKDGLDLYVDGDFLRAKGTTLGADDGIAIAYALAILDSKELSHPRIEVVITTNEEVGLLGAKDINLAKLRGHIMLNIDSDEEGHFLTSCAGGLSAHGHIPVQYQNKQGLGITIQLAQLAGGHSGSEIHRGRANAVVELTRLLKQLYDRYAIKLHAFSGGLKDNAIPRDASATIVVSEEAQDEILEEIQLFEQILRNEYLMSEPKIMLVTTVLENKKYSVLKQDSMQKVLFYLRSIPNGVINMSMNIQGLVETSLNLGIMELKDTELYTCTSVRSSVGSRKRDLTDRITWLVEYVGGTMEIEGDYPAWEYRADSKIREIIQKVYTEIYHKEPIFEAIHAGLECGMFSDKIEDLDAVSFGPNVFDIHTPNERLSISSTKRVWKFLTELLRSMK